MSVGYRNRTRLFLAGVFVLLIPLNPQQTWASGDDFIRFEETKGNRASLDTSVRSYRHPKTGRVVSLVGAVHIADKEYFVELQKILDSYDLVLFERVGTEDEKVSLKETRSALSIMAQLQMEVARMLRFEFQLERLDYTRGNLRHADISMARFEKEMGPQSLFPNQELMELLAPLLKIGVTVAKMFGDLDSSIVNELRTQVGKMLSDLDGALEQMGVDPDNPDDVIIGLRNRHAWEILQKALPEGHQRIAIFYGAAHMPDFERRLLEAGWLVESTHWVQAWRIPVPARDAPKRKPGGIEQDH